MGADEHDRFSGPLVDRHIGLLLGSLRESHQRKQSDKTGQNPSLHAPPSAIFSSDCATSDWANPLRIQTVQRPGKWTRFAHVLETADPRHHALNAHAEAAMRHAAISAQVKVP